MQRLKNKYERWYRQIVFRAKRRACPEDYERHHVVPKSLGGSDVPGNIVCLTPREHFLVHWLLIKFTEGRARQKMSFALHQMAFHRHRRSRSISSWQYEVARRDQVAVQKEIWNDPAHRQKHSESLKRAWADPVRRAKRLPGTLRAAKAGNDAWRGQKHKPETRTRIGNSNSKSADRPARSAWMKQVWAERKKKSS